MSIELFGSLAVLTVLIVLALGQLFVEANWPKALRVLLAFLTYSGVLVGLLRFRRKLAEPAARLPFWVFGAAGGAAGLVNGVARPTSNLALVLVSGLATALLGAGVHFLAVRSWRSLWGWITGCESRTQARGVGERRR